MRKQYNTNQIDASVLGQCLAYRIGNEKFKQSMAAHYTTAPLPSTRKDIIDTGRVLGQLASAAGSWYRRLGVRYDGQTIRFAITRPVRVDRCWLEVCGNNNSPPLEISRFKLQKMKRSRNGWLIAQIKIRKVTTTSFIPVSLRVQATFGKIFQPSVLLMLNGIHYRQQQAFRHWELLSAA